MMRLKTDNTAQCIVFSQQKRESDDGHYIIERNMHNIHYSFHYWLDFVTFEDIQIVLSYLFSS